MNKKVESNKTNYFLNYILYSCSSQFRLHRRVCETSVCWRTKRPKWKVSQQNHKDYGVHRTYNLLLLLVYHIGALTNCRQSWITNVHASLATQLARKYRLEQRIPTERLLTSPHGLLTSRKNFGLCSVMKLLCSGDIFSISRSVAKAWSFSAYT